MGVVMILVIMQTSCAAQSLTWAERMASSVMYTYPDSIVVKKYTTHGPSEEKLDKKSERPASWNYELGVVLKGFEKLWQQSGDKKYFTYLKKNIDHFVQDDGTIRTYNLLDYNIDDIASGRIVLTLYEETGEVKYKKAAEQLREQLTWQPRTKQGGFWHKHRYPYQMWLDGLYMAGPFYAQYSAVFNHPADFNDITNQFTWMEQHARDHKSGLLYHGWDESKQQRWAHPQKGTSPEFWSRAMGWYAMALVDVLDYLPKDHGRRGEIVSIFQRLAAALKNYQDNTSGLWYQVTDKGSVPGNYVEASGSCMFVYALAKGARMGYIEKSYSDVARKGFDGIIKNFIETDDAGYVHLLKSCSGAGLGGDPYRDGSFAYYIKEPIRTDDMKAIGPFILASIEIESKSNSK